MQTLKDKGYHPPTQHPEQLTHPNINLWSHIASSFKHLRGRVWWGATPGVELGVRTPEIREAEVCYFYIHLLI